MDVIFKRRSIRKFTNEEICDEIIERLIRAGMAAPSAHNEQPWQFVIIKDKEILHTITDFQPYSKMLLQANCAIVVCGDLSDERRERCWVQDCSAATQNILLMAESLGLGATWVSAYPVESINKPLKKLLELPDYVIPLSIIALGYPAETKPPIDRYDELRVHINKW